MEEIQDSGTYVSFFHGIPELSILQDLPAGLDLGKDHLYQLPALVPVSRHEEICKDLPVVFFLPTLGADVLHDGLVERRVS